MTTFGCPECGRNWQEGPTRDYTENYLCRKCTEALAKEAGEALLAENAERAEVYGHLKGFEPGFLGGTEAVLAKLRAAGILKGGE